MLYLYYCAVLIRTIFLCLIFFCLSCKLHQSKQIPSVLFLVVHSLGYDSISCHQYSRQTKRTSGFEVFCNSSVRFHRAYTPSVLAQPALASLLTGLYPYEHGLWSNGSQFLSSQFKTLPELALEKKYQSSFFSGGGAIWRKSGLSQGFQVFDDQINIQFNQVYRPAHKNVQLFLNWLDKFAKNKPFFSIIYFPDIQFPPRPKKSMGQLHNLEQRQKKDEVDQSIYKLVQELKKRKRWHSSYVVLMGICGEKKYQAVREKEIPAWSLYSDNTQLSLFIKGLSLFRKKPKYGNVTQAVSLVDVGATFFDLLGFQRMEDFEKKIFPVLSLKKYLTGDLTQEISSLNRKFNRPILLESGWPLWKKSGTSRFAIRQDPYLFIYDKIPKIYNSLTDRQELHSLPSIGAHPNLQNLKKKFLFYFKELGIQPWKEPSDFFREKRRIASKLFALNQFQPVEDVQNQLAFLMKKHPADRDLISWQANVALKTRNWKLLKNLGIKTKNFYWEYISIKNLNLSLTKIINKSETKCNKLFFKKDTDIHCENKSLSSLHNWIFNKNPEKNEVLKKRFFYFYLREKMDQQISHINQANYLVWDTHYTKFQEPLLADLFLALPEHKKISKVVQDALQFN